jgi:hypothetical protein
MLSCQLVFLERQIVGSDDTAAALTQPSATIHARRRNLKVNGKKLWSNLKASYNQVQSALQGLFSKLQPC